MFVAGGRRVRAPKDYNPHLMSFDIPTGRSSRPHLLLLEAHEVDLAGRRGARGELGKRGRG